ncbi:16S rRNA pseudouridine(516) synthase RsuA [Marinibactrum halimedae]|uniref:Pseudouridine synthase n=1 Tax=Marinibactrum halimedae TaxID=1444977 RepID=A0AA37WNL2_9GAMM|nr:16S rRNA pseudouridine(516) synthase RsuA [Marinibactrum halimedae]MCD9459520.1 16S rRNA pseudouridine(516) synthase RsuA [Marinibactrum halimedae]GLS28174.1 ribosomal small subunit pseudouridine synthase A [Marinibactrum halimedae]
MRLDKFISHRSPLSRSQVRPALKQGRITINGEIATNAAQKLTADDIIALDNTVLNPFEEHYWMFHKPLDCVCANQDSDHPTVLDFFADEDLPLKKALQIVGRLDIDTTGLVLLTTNGQWNHWVTSPKYQCEKRYLVTLTDNISTEAIQQLENGVKLANEPYPTKPAKVEVLFTNEIRLTISEGRYHQVKRMLAAVGNHVEALHRESIGTIQLDEFLAPGEYRPLTQAEIDSVTPS